VVTHLFGDGDLDAGHHMGKPPIAKEFKARKTHTIASSKTQKTEAVIGQATINLDSRVWKSLEDFLPELNCVDLAEAYVTQESASSRIFVRKKDMIRDCQTDACSRNL
jgi:hypothetical protein